MCSFTTIYCYGRLESMVAFNLTRQPERKALNRRFLFTVGKSKTKECLIMVQIETKWISRIICKVEPQPTGGN